MNAEINIYGQCEPPRDVEAYTHRSGRTGLAGELLMFELLSLDHWDSRTFLLIFVCYHYVIQEIPVLL